MLKPWWLVAPAIYKTKTFLYSSAVEYISASFMPGTVQGAKDAKINTSCLGGSSILKGIGIISI